MDPTPETQPIFFRFEELRIYHKAIDYIDWLYSQIGDNDSSKSTIIYREFYTAALSIAKNIAEGSTHNKTQFVHFLKLAKRVVRECVVLTSLAYKQYLFTEKAYNDSRNQLMEMTKMLSALIGSLQRSADTTETTEE